MEQTPKWVVVIGYAMGLLTCLVLTFPMHTIPRGSIWLSGAAVLCGLFWVSAGLVAFCRLFVRGCRAPTEPSTPFTGRSVTRNRELFQSYRAPTEPSRPFTPLFEDEEEEDDFLMDYMDTHW